MVARRSSATTLSALCAARPQLDPRSPDVVNQHQIVDRRVAPSKQNGATVRRRRQAAYFGGDAKVAGDRHAPAGAKIEELQRGLDGSLLDVADARADHRE